MTFGPFFTGPILRVRAKITSQNWRSDLVQVWLIRESKTTGIAGYFAGFADKQRVCKVCAKILNRIGGETMMEYKGYFAKVEFDDDANIFHGEVINLRDVITFEGETVKELKEAFQDSVDDYLDFCAKRGEDPEKPYSGKFVVRVEPELHKNITIEARKAGKSLNVWVNDTISKALKDITQGHSL